MFCLPHLVYEKRLKDGGVFYCPNGHENVFQPSENESLRAEMGRLRRQVALLQRESEWLRPLVESLRADVKHYQGQASGYKGQWALLKNRIEQGEASQGARKLLEPQP